VTYSTSAVVTWEIAQLRRRWRLIRLAMALTKLAIAEAQIGDLAGSGNDTRRALDHADRLSARERYYVEANYYAYHGQHEKSIESNKKLLALFPDHVSARNNLGVAYTQLERYEEARQQLEDLRRRGVALSVTYFLLASMYEGLGQSDKGLEIVQEFLQRNPDNALAHRVLAGFLTRMGKTDEALAALAKAEALDPAEPGIYSSRRTILLLKDQVDGVEAADRKSLATNNPTGRQQAVIYVANDVLLRGRTAEALKLLGSPPALLLESGQTERALVDAQRGLANVTGVEVVTALVPPPGVPVPPSSAFLAVIARAQARLGLNAEAAAIDQLTRIAILPGTILSNDA
jgi:tetratricopeptide (TPR) repeat protein